MESLRPTRDTDAPPPPPGAVALPPPTSFASNPLRLGTIHWAFFTPLALAAIMWIVYSVYWVFWTEQTLTHRVFMIAAPYAASALTGLWAWRRTHLGDRFSKPEWPMAWLFSYALVIEVVGIAIGSDLPIKISFFTPA